MHYMHAIISIKWEFGCFSIINGKSFKIFLIFIYLLSSSTSYAIQQPKFKNLIVHKDPIKHKEIAFNNLYNETINLDNYKNFLVIINFWATWCGPCRMEIPEFNELYKT